MEGGGAFSLVVFILLNGRLKDLDRSVAYSEKQVEVAKEAEKTAKEAEKLAWAEVERVKKEGEEKLDKLVMEIINTDDRYIKERELIKANDAHIEISEEFVGHLERKVFTVDEVENIPALRAGDDLTEFKKYIEIARQREDGWGAIQEKKKVLIRDFGRSPEEAEQIAREEYENNKQK